MQISPPLIDNNYHYFLSLHFFPPLPHFPLYPFIQVPLHDISPFIILEKVLSIIIPGIQSSVIVT